MRRAAVVCPDSLNIPQHGKTDEKNAVSSVFRRFLQAAAWYTKKNEKSKGSDAMNQTEFSACDDREFLSVQYESGKLVLTPQGEIDHHSAAPLRERMDHFLYRYRPQSCCIDLAKTAFMDSAGLGLLMGRYTVAASFGASFSVKNASAQIVKIIALSGLDRLIPTEQAAPADNTAQERKG